MSNNYNSKALILVAATHMNFTFASGNSNILNEAASERRYVSLPEPEPRPLQPNNLPYYRRFERRKPPR